jgi:inosine-uridine nucleoside N-ribohydrolase
MRLVVDSDGGIDDAAAIAWLALQPEVELAAVTAVGGNCDVHQAARNLRVILEAVGAAAVPVHVGADPSAPAPPSARPVMIHGNDGLGDVGFADPIRGADPHTGATEVLIREWNRGSRVLALGPLTNIASAVVQDPAAAANAAGFVLMGGSARAGGNARPTGEANVAHDPSAADQALRAKWSTPPVMVGLDVTHQATMRDLEFDLVAERRTPTAAFLDAPLTFYRRYSGTFCPPGEIPVHDLLAAMVAVNLDRDPIVSTDVLPVEVDVSGGAAWGMTVVDLRVLAWRARGAMPAEPQNDDGPTVVAGNVPAGGSDVAVALGVDVERFRQGVRQLAGA